MRGLLDSFRRGLQSGAVQYGYPLQQNETADDFSELIKKGPSKDDMILELIEQIEALQAEVADLRAKKAGGGGDVETLANVFRLTGFKKLLLTRYHQDANPKATAEEKEALTQAMQKINAAYEVVERLP